MRKIVTLSALLVVSALFLFDRVTRTNEDQRRQGWSEKDRQWFYHVTQGSQLIPYQWFLALEQPDNTRPFRANDVFERFQYIPDLVNPADNPDGLSIGFSKDSQDGEWLGMTCAACHTGEIEVESHGRTSKIRIDGGPAMNNLMGFLQFLFRSLDATLKDDAKFARFATAVLGARHNTYAEEILRAGLEKRAGFLERQAGLKPGSGNFTTPPPAILYGFGRADAIGLLTNQILGVKMGLRQDERPPDAPVSYPSLWYVARFDKLQWNGSVGHSTGRNIVEALGVFAHFVPPAPYESDRTNTLVAPFTSSVNMRNLRSLWSLIAQLRPPVWPAEINREKALRGKDIYDKNERVKCKECHSIVSTSANSELQWEGELVQVRSVGTDERMATNAECRTATTNAEAFLATLDSSEKGDSMFHQAVAQAAKEILAPECAGKTGGEGTTPARVLVRIVGTGVVVAQSSAWDLTRVMVQGIIDHFFPSQPQETPSKLSAYKAGPLNGVWATAPFLHNGSVANLKELLLPQERRKKTFCVGSRKFDSNNVGFATGDGRYCVGASLLDTTLPGNSNHGHSGQDYGTDLNEEERQDLLEYLKTL